MRARPILAVALAAACTATPSFAVRSSAVAPQVTDPKGDANGVNRQGVAPTAVPDGQATDPASFAAGDIVSVQWASTFTTTYKIVKRKRVAVKTPTGWTTTLTLAGAPANGVVYRIESASPTCASYWLEYRVAPDGSDKRTSLRCAADGQVWQIPDAVVQGSTIKWTVPFSAAKTAKPNMILSGLGAQTRGFVWFAGQTIEIPLLGKTTGLTVPQFDHATSETPFKIGS